MREFLKGLGFDQETIDSIMAEHGKLLTTSTEKITELTTQLNTLTAENSELKKVDAQGLQTQIETLTQENNTMKESHSQALSEIKFNSALELAVMNAKTVDPIALKAHLDVSKLKFNEETKGIDGLNEQLTGIKESHAYLFNVGATGTGHGDLSGAENQNVSLVDALSEKLK